MAKTKTTSEPRKTECPISKSEFMENAKPILIKIKHGDEEFSVALGRKEFSTGSFGWAAGGEKGVITVGDTPLKVQLGLNFTVVNSKEAKE